MGVKEGNLINSADFSVPWELICCKSLILLRAAFVQNLNIKKHCTKLLILLEVAFVQNLHMFVQPIKRRVSGGSSKAVVR